VRCVCLPRARKGAAAESRIRYRGISPGTGSGALLRFLYFIPPGPGPIKSALQYACGGTRLAFLVPDRAHARRLDAREGKKGSARVRGRAGAGRRASLLYFRGKVSPRATRNRVNSTGLGSATRMTCKYIINIYIYIYIYLFVRLYVNRVCFRETLHNAEHAQSIENDAAYSIVILIFRTFLGLVPFLKRKCRSASYFNL